MQRANNILAVYSNLASHILDLNNENNSNVTTLSRFIHPHTNKHSIFTQLASLT